MASGAQRNPAAGFALVDALVALLFFFNRHLGARQ